MSEQSEVKALTYTSYLEIDALLALQRPRSHTSATLDPAEAPPAGPPEHDEMLFIIIHQVYELWFKQILHELDFLCNLLDAGDTPRVLSTLRRILTILKTVVAQVDVLETMTPLEFNSFRGYLESASGFQSWQFRALEFALGHKRPGVFGHYPPESNARRQLEARYHAPSLWDHLLGYLATAGYAVPAALLQRETTLPLEPSPELQSVLIDIYRTNSDLSRVCERLVDLDEGMQEWRYRHVKMVERTIGHKAGTGGSSGVGYLASTIRPLFPDLWAIRSRL